MSRRAPAHLVQPVALAVGLLEDGGRALFLYQEPAPGAAAGGGGRAARAEAGAGGRLLELPSVLVMPGENPVSRLAEGYSQMTGIDAQVHETMRQASVNVGTRKRRHLVPVLVFRLTAKRMSARAGAGWNGFVWLAVRQALGEKFTRRGQWFLQPAMAADRKGL